MGSHNDLRQALERDLFPHGITVLKLCQMCYYSGICREDYKNCHRIKNCTQICNSYGVKVIWWQPVFFYSKVLLLIRLGYNNNALPSNDHFTFAHFFNTKFNRKLINKIVRLLNYKYDMETT